jgi:hypothetical protein
MNNYVAPSFPHRMELPLFTQSFTDKLKYLHFYSWKLHKWTQKMMVFYNITLAIFPSVSERN